MYRNRFTILYKINNKFNINYYFSLYKKIGYYKIKYVSNNLSKFINIVDFNLSL